MNLNFQMVDYLSDGMMVIEVVGKQKPPKTKKTVNTKDLLNKQALAKGAASGDTNTQVRGNDNMVQFWHFSGILLFPFLLDKIWTMMIRFQIGVSKKECKEGNSKDIEKVKCFSVFLHSSEKLLNKWEKWDFGHEWCFVFQTRFVRCEIWNTTVLELEIKICYQG